MMFLGDDKLTELTLNGSLKNVSVIDKIPLGLNMALGGPNDPSVLISMKLGKPMVVATSYPFTLAESARTSFIDLRPRTVGGATEGYVPDICDLVFDVKASGRSFEENGILTYAETGPIFLNVMDGCDYDPRSNEDRLIDSLRQISIELLNRKQTPGSYTESLTVQLLQSQNKRVKKLFEEFGELVQAFQRSEVDRIEIVSEAADLLYVIQVFLTLEGISLIEVLQEDIRRNQ